MKRPAACRLAGLVARVLLAAVALGGCRRAAVPLPAACNTIANDAAPVAFTPRSGTPPAFTGGRLEDGLYRATRVEGYGDVPRSGRRMTLAVSGGGTALAWSGDVLDATGATVLATIRANARITAAGAWIAVATSCSSVAPDPLPARLALSAKPGELALGLVDAGGTFVTTYTRVPGD